MCVCERKREREKERVSVGPNRSAINRYFAEPLTQHTVERLPQPSLCSLLLSPSISHSDTFLFSHPLPSPCHFPSLCLSTPFAIFLHVNLRGQAVHWLITALFSATIRPLHYPCTLFPLYTSTWDWEGRWRELRMCVCMWKKSKREGDKKKRAEDAEGERRELQRRMTSSSDQAEYWMTMLQVGAEVVLHNDISLHVLSTLLHWSGKTR